MLEVRAEFEALLPSEEYARRFAMTDAKQATPHADLLASLMNPCEPKTEREHAAVREIERLRAECLRLSHAEAEAMAVVLSLEEQVEKLRAELARERSRPDPLAAALQAGDVEYRP